MSYYFYNGKFYKKEENITISPFSFGLHYGYGIFSTILVKNKKPVFLNDHLERLSTSLNYFEHLLPILNYEKIMANLIDKNQIENGKIKIIFFEENSKISTLIIATEYLFKTEPLKLAVSKVTKENNPIYRHKTLNYLTNYLELKKAKKLGFSDTLFVDTKNNILETAIANIFFIKGNQIYTPPEKLPLLPGIIRKKLLKIKEVGKFKINEKIIKFEEINEFDAVFTTNSLKIISPVSKINNLHFDTEIPNRIKAYFKKYFL